MRRFPALAFLAPGEHSWRDRLRSGGPSLLRWLVVAVTVHTLGGAGNADDAAVLPRGVFRLSTEVQRFLPIDERFNPDGEVEDVAADFNRRLDSRVFRLLAPLDRLVAGGASIGDSEVAFEYQYTILDTVFAYGVTDRLTVAARIPYYWVKNRVRARLNSDPGSSANVGLNPRAGPAVIPLAAGGVRFTTEDVQQLLGGGLRGIPGFGFKRFKTWSDEDFGDFETGFKYQFFRSEDWRLAGSGGVRFPTGRVEDPDNLVDVNIGSGAYALLVRLHADYVLSNLWKRPEPATGERRPAGLRPGDVVVNGTFRYDLVLPDRQIKRVPDDVNNPITVNKEIVDRDLGDRFQFEISARYGLLRGLSLSTLYRYLFKLEDEISGKRGFAYTSLEEETDSTEHIYIVGLSYSTLPLYLEKKFPLPMNFTLGFRDRFAGSNNVFKARYISFGVDVLF